MVDNYIQKISALEKQMMTYYETEFPTETDESKENSSIKLSLLNIIVNANREFKRGSLSESSLGIIVRKGLMFLTDNTGCAEDLTILDNILSELVNLRLIDRAEADDLYSENATARWR